MLEVVIFLLLIFIGIQEYFNRKERKHLIEVIVAKNLQDLASLEYQRKLPNVEEEPKEELVPVSELPEDKFDEYVKKVNET